MHNSHADVAKLRANGVVKLKGNDLFAMWIKTACCNLNSTQLKGIAKIAKNYGNDLVLFSSRQIPIIPFIHLKNVETVKKELETLYLELDRCGPTVRNINVCYDNKICPHAVANSLSLGEKLDNFFRVPSRNKIKIGVVGCEKNCIISRALNDVSFVATTVGYDAFVGGKLGVKPFIAIKMAKDLTEEQCVKFVQNYFDFMKTEGKMGERGAELINRFGKDYVIQKLTKDLETGMKVDSVTCESHINKSHTDKIILKIKAVCGETNSKQVIRIADIAEKYGKGFVHFSVRGSPEIPYIDKKDIEQIKKELKEVDLDTLDEGIDNIQSCFGDYCTETIADAQGLLKKINKLVKDINLNNQKIKISGSGCPNACGIVHINDIGFHGAVEPVVEKSSCNGCGLCANVCKKKAIMIKDNLAIIDDEECKRCGHCISVCPTGAMKEGKKGFTVYLGGKEGKETRLGIVVDEFLSENEALELTKRCLTVLKEKNKNVSDIIDEVGLEKFKEMIKK